MPFLDRLVKYAIAYYEDFVKAHKAYVPMSDIERAALEDLLAELRKISDDEDSANIQSLVFEVGKRHNFTDLKSWFIVLYKHLFGQQEGPRMGSFIALYGVANTCNLIEEALHR
jgi:lysyl-tRNA synthetase class 1